MKRTFDISIGRIRRISVRLLMRRKPTIALFVVMALSLLLSIYCLIIGNLVDEEAFRIAYTSLSLFVILLAASLVCFAVYVFKKIPGKGKDVVRYEYEFLGDEVMVRNLSRDTAFVLKKRQITKHWVISGVLVVAASLYYFFPNDEEVTRELGLGKEAASH